MEGELIIVSMISSIFGLYGLFVLTRMKERLLKVKGDQKIREIKARSKAKTTVTAPRSAPGGKPDISNLLNIASQLDGDQIGNLIDLVSGDSSPESSSDLLSDIIESNPELVQSFLKGFGKGGKSETTETGDHPDQMY